MSSKTKRKNEILEKQNRIVGLILFAILLISGIIFALTQSSTNISMLNEATTPVCFWNWAYGDITPQQFETLNNALTDAGFIDYELTASAYGEDQICQQDDEIISSQFHLMDMTPTIIIHVDSQILDNPTELGANIRHIINAILSVNDSLPKISKLEVQFINGEDIRKWSAPPSEFTPNIPLGTTDNGLYALGLQDS